MSLQRREGTVAEVDCLEENQAPRYPGDIAWTGMYSLLHICISLVNKFLVRLIYCLLLWKLPFHSERIFFFRLFQIKMILWENNMCYITYICVCLMLPLRSVARQSLDRWKVAIFFFSFSSPCGYLMRSGLLSDEMCKRRTKKKKIPWIFVSLI